MNQLHLLDELYDVLGIRVRTASDPDMFPRLRRIFVTLAIFSNIDWLDTLIDDSTGQSAVVETDERGSITGLMLPSMEVSTDLLVERLTQLQDLNFLFLESAIGSEAANRIRSLSNLRHLVTTVADDEADETIRNLSRGPALEGLFLHLGKPKEPVDISPLKNVKLLRSLVLNGSARGLDALSGGSLQHLLCRSSAFADAKSVAQFTHLETMGLLDREGGADVSFLALLPQLRGLLAPDTEVPVDILRRLSGLTMLGVRYPSDSLDALSFLTDLEELKLGAATANDFAPLLKSPRLKYLSVEDGQTQDISTLAGHPTLEGLNLSRVPVSKTPEDLALPRLRSLVWTAHSEHQLTTADFLSSCTALERLKLDTHRMADLRFLRRLGNLSTIDVARNRLTHVNDLANLPGLVSLNLDDNMIGSLAPLSHSDTLTSLSAAKNPIGDASVIEGLYRLEYLNLNGTGIADLTFVKRLTNLFRLNVAENHLESLEPVLELPRLAHLDVKNNRITNLSKDTLDALRSLDILAIEGNALKGIEPEVYAGDGRKVLKSLRDYYRSLSRGQTKHDRVKLLLVGNGRVGKTSLVTRLVDGTFDPNQPSTHGIQLRRWSLEHVADDKLDGRPLQINIWDFGGQDIYHATHRLFMRTRALYLLVWDRQTENELYSLDEFGERYENFKLPYWIDYIKALSGSPVVVVQNKVDTLHDKQPGYGVELQEIYGPPGGILDYQYVSAQLPNHNGMPGLVDSMCRALGQLESIGRELPSQWIAVRDRLADIQRPYIESDEFVRICRDVGLNGNEHTSVAHFLHQAGDLFYQPQSFGDRLILDQRWAIEAVYALLDRRGAAYRDLKAASRNGLDVELLKRGVWKRFSDDERVLLLEFLKSCELCFEFSEGLYYVPQMLPDDRPSRVALRWKEPTDFSLQITYKFLHRAIVDRFLVRTGSLGADTQPEIWRNGIVILDDTTETEALVEAFPSEGRVLAQAKGTAAIAMLQMIQREFDELHVGFPAIVSVSADRGRHYVDLQLLRQYSAARAATVPSIGGALVDTTPLAPFLAQAERKLPRGLLRLATSRPAIPVAAKPQIFLSYAWGDITETGESREAIVDRLNDALVTRGYDVVRDKQDAGYKAIISEFMQRIAVGDVVITVISDKYLKSPYCMYELLEIYDRGDFKERVFPIVLGDARLHTLEEQLDYVIYWKQRKQAIEEKMQAIGFDAFSPDGAFKVYERYYKRVFRNLDRILSLLADWNALTPRLLEEKSFDRVLSAIQERRLEASSEV